MLRVTGWPATACSPSDYWWSVRLGYRHAGGRLLGWAAVPLH